jgi:NAD(P)-dependent dehydrogenase (short-subunit alcohol dehydrogenase family)
MVGMDKSILITGCSSGIGLCAAVALLHRILPAGALDAVARRN